MVRLLENNQLPNIDAMVGTYRGSIEKDHYLYNKNEIVSTYYKEMYVDGRIEESSFDEQGVRHDTDTMGKINVILAFTENPVSMPKFNHQ